MKKLSPEEGYARYAFEYDDKEKYWNSFEQGCFDPYLKMIEGKKVLDAGAGTGRLSVKLAAAGAEVTALDISSDMLQKISQKNGEIETVLGNMEELPFEDNTFDFVFSSMAMVHLKKVDQFLDECYRVVKDDGLVLVLNIHYRKPLILRDGQGSYTIQCYNHYPKHVTKAAQELAFGIEEDRLITEGDDVWVSQFLCLRK